MLVSIFFYYLRDALFTYITAHPIRFDLDEIVEVDELYLHAVNVYDAEGEYEVGHWIVAFISRKRARSYFTEVYDRDMLNMLAINVSVPYLLLLSP